MKFVSPCLDTLIKSYLAFLKEENRKKLAETRESVTKVTGEDEEVKSNHAQIP